MIKFLKNLFSLSVQPESSKVYFDNTTLYCSKPNSETETILWQNIDAILIETTDAGPIAEDVFWLFLQKNMESGCIVPQGAIGNEKLLNEVQERFENLDNENLINAMASTENQKFLLWQRAET